MNENKEAGTQLFIASTLMGVIEITKKTGNSSFLKKHNETLILDLIRTHKAISKADISRLTGLSATAAGVLVSGLMEKGYIHEAGTGSSRGGRRPILLELRHDSFYSVGLDIDVGIISAVVLDLTGKTVFCCEELLSEHDMDFNGVLEKIKAVVQNAVNTSIGDVNKLVGIGISVPGTVDASSRRLVMAPNLRWENIDMLEHMKALLSVPWYLENEAMASAVAESWMGGCLKDGNFVCINIKSGIGAGIFANGRLYRGTGGSAGEVGHIVVDENGPKCGCGNYGCLETMASTGQVVEKARRLVRQGLVSSLNSYPSVEDIGINEIIKEAEQGDEASRAILLEAARYIGIAAANVVNALNPSKVVLGRDFCLYSSVALEYVREYVRKKALGFAAGGVEILTSPLGERSSVLGAAVIPLKVLFGR